MIIILSYLASNLESSSDYYKFLLEFKGGQDDYLNIINKALSSTANTSDKEYVIEQLKDSCKFCRDGKSLYNSFMYDVENIVHDVVRLTRDKVCPDICNVKIVDNTIYVTLNNINRARTYSNINKVKRYFYNELRNKIRN